MIHRQAIDTDIFTYMLDITQTALNEYDPEEVTALLLDHSTHRNILWCTDDYVSFGDSYSASDEITVEKMIKPM